MLNNHMSVVENVNLNFGSSKQIDNKIRERIYETLYEPLLHVCSQWRIHAEDLKPLIEHTARQIEIPILPVARMVEKIKEYNNNYVKEFSLGNISGKYKQSSSELVKLALTLDKEYANAYEIDRKFNTIMMRIKRNTDLLISMLKNDFCFQ